MLAFVAVPPFALAVLLILSPIRFPNSGSPPAQPSFLRGVTALAETPIFDRDYSRFFFSDVEPS